MKKRGLIVALVIAIILIIILVLTIYINKKPKTISDYTELGEKIYYKEFSSLFSAKEIDYDLGKTSQENYICITVIDTNLNPIKGAEVEFYDKEGYLITAQETDENGIIAISELENNKKIYFKQTKTREGLIIDDTMYYIETNKESNRFVPILVNGDRKLEKEEVEKIEDKYITKDEANYDVITSEQRTKEKNTKGIEEYRYIIKKDELNKKELIITSDNEKRGVNGISRKCTIRIPDTYIQKVEIEVLKNNDRIKILDENDKERYTFENGESFYIEYGALEYIGDVKYNFTITFTYNNKNYKIKKSANLFSNPTASLGMIELMAYKPNTDEPLEDTTFRLVRIYDNNDTTNLGDFETGSSGKITYYKVPKGQYKLVKIIDDKEVETKIFEVKSGETTQVEFR